MSTPEVPPVLPPAQPKKKHGFLFYFGLSTSIATLIASVLLLAGLIVLVAMECRGCSAPTDDRLIKEFPEHRAALEQLRTLTEKGDTKTEQYQELMESMICRETKDAKQWADRTPSRNKDGFILIPVWGFCNCASSHWVLGTSYCYVEKGYAYCPDPPDAKKMCPLLGEPTSEGPSASGTYYRHLEGNWWLYRQNQ